MPVTREAVPGPAGGREEFSEKDKEVEIFSVGAAVCRQITVERGRLGHSVAL